MTRGCYLGYYGVNETGMNVPVESFEFPLSLSSLQSFEVKDEFEDEEEMQPLTQTFERRHRSPSTFTFSSVCLRSDVNKQI